MADLSVATNGTITVYVKGKKVFRGTLAQCTEYLTGAEAPRARPKKVKPPSRTQRWSDACTKATEALEELVEIQQEFEDWKGNLPENLQSSALADKLETVTGIDLQSALDAAQEAEAADLPLGFGRD